MIRKLNGQILFALILMGLNTIYASQVFQMATPFASGEPGPAFLPILLCAFVYIAVFVILVTEGLKSTGGRIIAEQSEYIPCIDIAGPIATILLTVSFIISFSYAGYVVSSLGYTFLIALYFTFEERGKWKRAMLMATLTSGGVTMFGWLFFVRIFGLYLPVWEL